MNTITNWFNNLKEKYKTAKEERETRNEVRGFLDDVDEKYYAQIFRLINDTIVIGNKNKYNTLEYLEQQIMTSDARDMKELGFGVKVNENCLNKLPATLGIAPDAGWFINDIN